MSDFYTENAFQCVTLLHMRMMVERNNTTYNILNSEHVFLFRDSSRTVLLFRGHVTFTEEYYGTYYSLQSIIICLCELFQMKQILSKIMGGHKL